MVILSLHLLVFKLVNYMILLIYDLPIECLADTFIKGDKQFFWIIYVFVGIGLPLLLQRFFRIVVERKSFNKKIS